jgi:hypothetical protein
VNRSKFTKGKKDEGTRLSQAHNLGVQVSLGVYYEVPEESVVWAVKKKVLRDFLGSGLAEGNQDRRGASNEGSCAHAH